MKRALTITLCFIALLWSVKSMETLFQLNFLTLGVYPHSISGLIGIFSAPLVHGSWPHLISNTAPLLVLGVLLRYGYPKAWGIAFATIYLGSGLAVWLFARSSYHIGASGLTHGLMFFIFTSGVLRRDRLSIALSLVTFFLYGGMIWSIFPNDPDISFEMHFFGAAVGLVMAFVLRNKDAPQAEKTYDWEQDPEREDPVIGDAWKKHESDD